LKVKEIQNVSICFQVTAPRVMNGLTRTSLPECVEDDSTNSDGSNDTSDRLSSFGLDRFTGTVRTESNVVGYSKYTLSGSHVVLRVQERERLDVQAFFSSRESSFQSFFCSSSRCLKVCSCSAGVKVFHDASIYSGTRVEVREK